MSRHLRGLFDLAGQILSSTDTTYKFSAEDLQEKDQHADEVKDDSFTALCYNINFSFARRPECPRTARILDAIENSRATVVLLQETTQHWEAVLRNRFQQIYPFQAYHHAGGSSGSAVLSKLPFLPLSSGDRHHREHIVVPSRGIVEGSWTDPLVVGVAVGSSCVLLASVHLRPPVHPDGSAGVTTAEETGAYRREEAKNLLEHLQKIAATSDSSNQHAHKPIANIIIAGDFNEQDGAQALGYLCGKGRGNGGNESDDEDQASFSPFTDALAKFVPYSKETHRWNKRLLKGVGIGTPVLMKKRLDHMLYRDLNCVGCGVLTGYEEGASDHQPVLGRFNISH